MQIEGECKHTHSKYIEGSVACPPETIITTELSIKNVTEVGGSAYPHIVKSGGALVPPAPLPPASPAPYPLHSCPLSPCPPPPTPAPTPLLCAYAFLVLKIIGCSPYMTLFRFTNTIKWHSRHCYHLPTLFTRKVHRVDGALLRGILMATSTNNGVHHCMAG